MANKEKIDYLLIDIRELEKLVAGMRDAEIYPASFFNQTFQLTHKVLKELHTLEEFQLEALRKQMEEHQRLIDSIPVSKPLQMPVVRVSSAKIRSASFSTRIARNVISSKLPTGVGTTVNFAISYIYEKRFSNSLMKSATEASSIFQFNTLFR